MSDIRKRVGAKGTTYQVRYPSKNTKSGYAYATFATRKEAAAFRETIGALPNRAASAVEDVSEAITLWLDICEKIGRDGRETVEPETRKEYQRRANVMREYCWQKSLQELEPADIVHFRNWLLENKSRDLARRTLSSFHSVLIEMKHQGHLRDDPAAGITIKTGGRYEDDNSDVQIPSDQEMRDILGAADAMGAKNDFMKKCWARYRPMIYLAAFSGMRPSEYRGLPWSSITDNAVDVKQRADKTGIVGPVKSKAGRRKIYLPSFVTDMIEEWREHCPESPHDLVFPTENGKSILLHNISLSAWQPLLREAGLTTVERKNGKEIHRPKYTPYALRHYYASKLIEKTKGQDLKFIQTAMGHSRIEITLNVYGHLIKDKGRVYQETIEGIATELIASSCGKSVARDQQV